MHAEVTYNSVFQNVLLSLERTQWSKALVTEDTDSIPSNHVATHRCLFS